MTIREAKEVAANPSANVGKLMLAHLKLTNAVLRAFPSSQRQKDLQKLVAQIEVMPRELWFYAE